MAVYAKRYPFCAEEGSGLTLLEAERAFQLLPDPPKVENLNDYIVLAVNGDKNGFSFFLHAYEERLNRRIRGFLLREGFQNNEPDRLFDYKLACVRAMMEVLPGYDPNGGASFLTYAHHDIENAIIGQRKNEEGGSFASLDEYKAVRKAGRLYRENHEKTREAVKAIAEAEHCSEQTLLEKRNAICMTCGRVSDWRKRIGFEDLTMLFEGSGASGAERAYQRALEKMMKHLAGHDVFHVLQLRLISQEKKNKKIDAAVYSYWADYDGDWGEIRFDF